MLSPSRNTNWGGRRRSWSRTAYWLASPVPVSPMKTARTWRSGCARPLCGDSASHRSTRRPRRRLPARCGRGHRSRGRCHRVSCGETPRWRGSWPWAAGRARGRPGRHLALAAQQVLQRQPAEHVVDGVLQAPPHRADRAVAACACTARRAAGVALAEAARRRGARPARPAPRPPRSGRRGAPACSRRPGRACCVTRPPRRSTRMILATLGGGDALQALTARRWSGCSPPAAPELQQAAQAVLLLA